MLVLHLVPSSYVHSFVAHTVCFCSSHEFHPTLILDIIVTNDQNIWHYNLLVVLYGCESWFLTVSLNERDLGIDFRIILTWKVGIVRWRLDLSGLGYGTCR
jgi:hypothetical protein